MGLIVLFLAQQIRYDALYDSHDIFGSLIFGDFALFIQLLDRFVDVDVEEILFFSKSNLLRKQRWGHTMQMYVLHANKRRQMEDHNRVVVSLDQSSHLGLAHLLHVYQ